MIINTDVKLEIGSIRNGGKVMGPEGKYVKCVIKVIEQVTQKESIEWIISQTGSYNPFCREGEYYYRVEILD